ncbi:MAG: site-specific DNA-methyltransferase [Chloroflexi bacterium]|nr:site-specific DNA-methyltransferase [Chloroflexota bacterium]
MPTLDWIGKRAVVTHHTKAPFHLLKPRADLSLAAKPDATDRQHLIVQGDNLLGLKALLPRYAGQVKCIYIDPPYNTGNEGWVYNDAVNSPEMRAWLGKTVGAEAEDLTRHDKWLCMMYPRLVLLRQFLREDGSLWMSIDDNEVHHARMLLDEIFGAQNFVANVVWQKKYAVANDHKSIAPMHDHILVYQKTLLFNRNLLPRSDDKDRQYRFEDDQGIFRPDNYTCNKTAEERPNLYYPVVNPNTGEEIWPKRTSVWRYSIETHRANEAQNLIWWGKDGKGKVPAFKRYRHALRGGGGSVPPTWWTFEDAGHTDEAKKEIRSLDVANEALDFVTPKPTRLIKRILQIATNQDDLVLDSFAGSGTTAHAVMALNAEDGGQRKCILVEIDAHIAQNITAERVRRVIAREGWGDGFEYCELGETLFDPSGDIRSSVSYADLAEHVFFVETGRVRGPITATTPPLVGVANDTAVYLLYNGVLKDKAVNSGNVLTPALLASLPPHNGRKVIYGTACRLSVARLQAENITFRQIPYDVRQA